MSNGPFFLSCWSVREYNNGFMAPEARPRVLVGISSGHDGQKVTTSNIRDADGKVVYTENSVYHLLDIDPEYLAHLERNGYDYDPEHPIKLVDNYTELKVP